MHCEEYGSYNAVHYLQCNTEQYIVLFRGQGIGQYTALAILQCTDAEFDALVATMKVAVQCNLNTTSFDPL